MAQEFQITIRKANSEDMNFIFATWLRSFRHFSYFAKRIKNHIYFKWHHELIDRILKRETTTILIATPKDEPELIMGYLVSEDWDDFDVIHFIYIKGCYEKKGIGKMLMNHAEIDIETSLFSHWTYPMDELIKKYPNLTYSPYHI